MDASAGLAPSERGEPGEPALSRAEEYALKKELASTERRLETLAGKAEAVRIELDAADPSDFELLLDVQSRLRTAEDQLSELEDRWLELSERLSETPRDS